MNFLLDLYIALWNHTIYQKDTFTLVQARKQEEVSRKVK